MNATILNSAAILCLAVCLLLILWKPNIRLIELWEVQVDEKELRIYQSAPFGENPVVTIIGDDGRIEYKNGATPEAALVVIKKWHEDRDCECVLRKDKD